MKQKKQHVKLYNPVTEQVEKTISKIKHNLTNCPLPSDIDELIQSIFNSLLDTIPNIDPDLDIDVKSPLNTQLINKTINNHKSNNDINGFNGFWAEWLKFRASVWSLSSISVVDDIYESYIKERIEELKIIIDNVENQEQLTAPVIKHEFSQAKELVDKAFLNLQSIIINQITNFDDFDDENDNGINQEKEQERIRNLMSHRSQIRRIKEDFSNRYKTFFQLSSQERSITDVQHRRCVSIIEEMLNALNKLGKQQSNFQSLKEELYLAEQKLLNETIPISKKVSIVPIYKDQSNNPILPEDAESENAEAFINNLLSSRNNSPFDSPLTSPTNNLRPANQNKNDTIINTPVKKLERAWKTPEPQAPPVRIQPLSLHEFSGMPDSFKDLSKRFNTSDSESQSTPSTPDTKSNYQQKQQKKTFKPRQKQQQTKKFTQKVVTFAKDNIQTNPIQKENPNDTSLQPTTINNNQTSPKTFQERSTEIQNNDENDTFFDDRGTSPSTSSYTSDNEDPATVSSTPKTKQQQPIHHSSGEDITPHISSNDRNSQAARDDNSSKNKKSDDSLILYQKQQQQQRIQKQQNQHSSSERFNSSFLRPKRKSADYKTLNSSSNIFSSSSPLNHSLESLTFKQKQKQKHSHSMDPRQIQKEAEYSSCSPQLSPKNISHSDGADQIRIEKLKDDDDENEFNLLIEEEEEEGIEYNDNRDELTKLKDDYETLNIQLNVYSEENRELHAANEEIPFLKRSLYFYSELEMFYEDEISRLHQTQASLSSRIKKKTKDDSIYLENSRLHREKDQLFAKLQGVQKELAAVTSRSTSSNDLLLMLRSEREKNERLSGQIRDLELKRRQKSDKGSEDDENDNQRKLFESKSEMAKLQIKMQNLNLKILHLKAKVKRYKIRLNENDSSQSKERKEVENLENEIAAIRNSFESIQDLRFTQQDELFKLQTKNAFLQSTIDKLKKKIDRPSFDIESEVMNELKEKIQENFSLKNENEKVKSTLFELYHLICGEALTDNVNDVSILLDGIREHLVLDEMPK